MEFGQLDEKKKSDLSIATQSIFRDYVIPIEKFSWETKMFLFQVFVSLVLRENVENLSQKI